MCLVLSETWIHLIEQKYTSQFRGKPQYEESLVACFLENLGLSIEYERIYHEYNNITPDWTILNDNSKPIAIVEVLTINESCEKVIVSHPQVKDLLARLQKKRLNAILKIILNDDLVLSKGLTPNINKKISTGVERWLNKNNLKQNEVKVIENIEFQFISSSDSFGYMVQPTNLIARFDIEKEMSRAKDLILEKVCKYRELVEKENMFLIIGVVDNSLIMNDIERVKSISTRLFYDQILLNSVITFNRVFSKNFEVRIINNPLAGMVIDDILR